MFETILGTLLSKCVDRTVGMFNIGAVLCFWLVVMAARSPQWYFNGVQLIFCRFTSGRTKTN